MQPEEMLSCFSEAESLFRSLLRYTADPEKAAREYARFSELADTIGSFVNRATGAEGNALADLALEFIRDPHSAKEFVHGNARFLPA